MPQKVTVQKRQEIFAQRTATRIWYEQPSADNPYLAETCLCQGYDLFELINKRSFVEVFYLLFRGELPTRQQSGILEKLMVALINPGPRHPAARAAMNAAVSKTNTAHLLPIAMSVLGGKHLGGEEVVAAMRFLNESRRLAPAQAAAELLQGLSEPGEGDWHPVPGFGTRYGGIDPLPQEIAATLLALDGAGETLLWGQRYVEQLLPAKQGWLISGVAAAVFCDLGFAPRAGAGLFQLLSAPGLLAHGLELADQPITAMPFLGEDDYVIDENARKKG